MTKIQTVPLLDRLGMHQLANSDSVELAGLIQDATPSEREALEDVAGLHGCPTFITIADVREAQKLAAEADKRAENPAVVFERKYGKQAIKCGPPSLMLDALAPAPAPAPLPPPDSVSPSTAAAASSVRGLTLDDWATEKTTRAAYLPAGIVSTIGVKGDAEINRYLDTLNGSEVNAIVIDQKEGDGRVLVTVPGATTHANDATPAIDSAVNTATIAKPANLTRIIELVHARGYKAVVRQVLFKDTSLVRHHPEMAIQDKAGGPWGTVKQWVNPWSRDAGTYNIEIAKRALEAGADEIQWDYVRFPDGYTGDRSRAVYPGRPDGADYYTAIAGFLERASTELKAEYPDAKLGADVFGYVANGTNVHDHLGQDVGLMAQYLDVIWPMQYPSHWAAKGTKPFGDAHPETQPELVYKRTTAALLRQLGPRASDIEVRPWLQAFYLSTFGHVTMQQPVKGHLGAYVDSQIAGIQPSDGNGYALWGVNAGHAEAIRRLRAGHSAHQDTPAASP